VLWHIVVVVGRFVVGVVPSVVGAVGRSRAGVVAFPADFESAIACDVLRAVPAGR